MLSEARWIWQRPLQDASAHFEDSVVPSGIMARTVAATTEAGHCEAHGWYTIWCLTMRYNMHGFDLRLSGKKIPLAKLCLKVSFMPMTYSV